MSQFLRNFFAPEAGCPGSSRRSLQLTTLLIFKPFPPEAVRNGHYLCQKPVRVKEFYGAADTRVFPAKKIDTPGGWWYIKQFIIFMGPLAQLVEQVTLNH